METTPQRKYPIPDVKILYSLAAGRCSLPDCRQELILTENGDQYGKQFGIIAHIIAHSGNGPRGDLSYPAEKLDTYENWILLCPTCHAKVDLQPDIFTITKLREIKQNHETWVRECLAIEIPNVGFTELETITRVIIGTPISASEDFSLTPLREKMAKNGLTSGTNFLVTIGLSKRSEVRNYIQHVVKIDPEFPNLLKTGFLAEYDRLHSATISGDRLFQALFEFAAGGSSDFRRRAAGLAVLTYLFEICDIFEK